MPLAVKFFLQYAYPILFLWVLAEQLGAPFPSMPILLTAGSFTATHKLSLILVLMSVLAGCFVSDSIWYFLGKRFGGSVVKLLCRLSLEASTCVRRTENYFTRHGPEALLFAKFVPGLGTVAAPIAGQMAMPYSTFLLYDLTGAFIWGGAVIVGGRFFGDVLKRNPQFLSWVGHFAGVLFLLAILGFLIHRIWKQQSFLKQVKTARIQPEELKEILDSGQKVFIVDLRHPLDYLPDPRVLPGALRLSPEDLILRNTEIPRDQDVVLYCTCPSEATAAKTALTLRQIGIHRVRPLLGGFDAWKKLGFPLQDYEEAPAGVA